MSRLTKAMQGFLFDLRQRSERIKRGGRLDSIEFSPVADNKFTVTVKWTSASQGPQQYVRLFTVETVFKNAGTGRMIPADRPCNVANKFIKEIQRQQGRRGR